MLFSSLVFLWIFLPLVLILYRLLPGRGKNALLLVASLFFYAWGEPVYILLMLASITLNYLGGLLLDGREGAARKLCLALVVAVNLALLGYYKYYSFAGDTLAALLGRQVLPVRDIALPLGISFYTFQAMSYVIDLYRRRIGVQKSWFLLALYISFFPQLVAGPIVRYTEVEAQLRRRTTTLDGFTYGIKRFLYGLAKKVILANCFAARADEVFGLDPSQVSTPLAWLGALYYTLQIYYDFSGYSDMAIGLGAMFGFTFPENFNYPYLSRTVSEFWRRWHMTLSGWFREYVYIPLGGNRKGLKRQIFNLFVVELLTGIWHGANWNFICWGLYYFVLLAVEKLFLLPHLQKGRVWPHIYTLFLVVVGWAMFVGNDTGVSFGLLFHKLFVPSGGVSPLYFLRNYGVLLVVSILCCTPLIEKIWNLLKKNAVTRCAAILALLVVSTAYVVGSTNSPFLYFNF